MSQTRSVRPTWTPPSCTVAGGSPRARTRSTRTSSGERREGLSKEWDLIVLAFDEILGVSGQWEILGHGMPGVS